MKLTHLYALLTVCLLWACSPYPNETDYVSDYDIVYTNYDKDANFSSFQTFILPNKIANLNDSDEESYLDDTNPEIANLIKSELRSNMVAAGYTEVTTSSANPDLILNAGVFDDQYANYYGDYCWWYNDPYYWGWYGGWNYYPGSYWGGYPCYGGGYYSYQTGSIVLDLIDVAKSKAEGCDQANNDCRLEVIWNGMIRGLLTGNEENLKTRISSSIDQAFDQSSYLKK